MEKKNWLEPFNKIRWGQAVNIVSNRHPWNDDNEDIMFGMCMVRYKQLEEFERKAEAYVNAERQKTIDDVKKEAGVLDLG